MIPNLKLYGAMTVGAAFLCLGIYAGYQKLHVERLKTQIAQEHEAHALALSKALADQAKVLDLTAQKERKRIARLEQDKRNLLAEARKATDALYRMSDYLRIVVNGMLDSARREYGGVLPANTSKPVDSRSATDASPPG